MNLPAAANFRLSNDPAITATIAKRADGTWNISPDYDREADHQYPLIAYRVEAGNQLLASDGPDGLLTDDLIIACIAKTRAQADATASAVVNSMNGDRSPGSIGWGGGAGFASVSLCMLRANGIERSDVVRPESEELLAFVTTVTFSVAYSDA